MFVWQYNGQGFRQTTQTGVAKQFAKMNVEREKGYLSQLLPWGWLSRAHGVAFEVLP